METMIEDIISCNTEKDELIQTLMIKILVQLATHYNTEVHNKVLSNLVYTLIMTYSSNNIIKF